MNYFEQTINIAFLALTSYLEGSVPFGLLIGKSVKGIDLRDHGSGNIGATNVGRILGKKWGLICLALDALKGMLPVAELPSLFITPDNSWIIHARVLAGIATIVGHMFPIWLGFQGGKGVATSLGVLLILSPWGGLVAAILFFGSLLVWRYVSLSSMIAAVSYGTYELIRLSPSPFGERTWSQAAFAVLVPSLIIIQHRSNIRRLLRGEEPPFTGRKSPANDPQPTKSATEKSEN